MSHHVEVLQHDVICTARDGSEIYELSGPDIEHIEMEISDGTSSGLGEMEYTISEGNEDHEATVNWEIIAWKAIALDLYNSVTGDGPLQAQAKKRFDEAWALIHPSPVG